MARLALILDESEETYFKHKGYETLRTLMDEARVLCRRADRCVTIETKSSQELWSSDEDP